MKKIAFLAMLLPALTGGYSVVHAATGDPVLINEVLVSHVGYDDTEYIELFGTPGYSLAGLSVIDVESKNSFGAGQIRQRFDLGGGETLGRNGFFLIGDATGLMTHYGVTPNLAIPPALITIPSGALGNYNSTLALVATSSLSGPSVTGSETVLDAVALTDGSTTGNTFFFNAPVVGPDGTFFPAGARRVLDGVDTDTVNDWVLADFNLGPANTPTAGTAVPVPGAILLSTLGVGLVGWLRRRRAL